MLIFWLCLSPYFKSSSNLFYFIPINAPSIDDNFKTVPMCSKFAGIVLNSRTFCLSKTRRHFILCRESLCLLLTDTFSRSVPCVQGDKVSSFCGFSDPALIFTYGWFEFFLLHLLFYCSCLFIGLFPFHIPSSVLQTWDASNKGYRKQNGSYSGRLTNKPILSTTSTL